jgi:thioredoxin-like negative regulator of GroEL
MNRDKIMVCIFIAVGIGIFLYFQSELENKKLIERLAPLRKVIMTAKRPRVVCFTAQWNAPCQQFKPVLKKVMDNYSQSIDCDIINTDNKGNKNMVDSFAIKSIPAIYVFDRQGNLVFKHVGYVESEELDYYLRKTIL